MPFESKKQMGWMFANHPKMAKEWAAYTPDIKDLPEKAHPFHRLKQYFENGGTVEPEPEPTPHSPSNINETNILLDALASGQIEGRPTLISPESIEVADAKGTHDYDPKLVDPAILEALTQAYGKPYGPVPQHYEHGGKVPGKFTGKPDTVDAKLTVGEEVLPRDVAVDARHGKFKALHDYFAKYAK